VVQHGLEVVSGRIGQQRVADYRLLQLVLAEGRRARSQSLEKNQIQFFKSSGLRETLTRAIVEVERLK
jgi:hypothetical protein